MLISELFQLLPVGIPLFVVGLHSRSSIKAVIFDKFIVEFVPGFISVLLVEKSLPLVAQGLQVLEVMRAAEVAQVGIAHDFFELRLRHLWREGYIDQVEHLRFALLFIRLT